ncbi:hypothetical protein ACFYPC_36740 [Streptomyces sp. NPDC005808]|uniref:hypothetical protein n=1 Tax=Streptomyces sp. NPDC005808 TaxID=3364734 RepID=UPI0036B9A535
MEPLPYALTGYLDRIAVPGTGLGTAAWRLTSSPDNCTEEQEAVIPCVTSNPDLAHTLLTECQPGDLLRVTGHLTLPDTAEGHIRLDADTLEVLPETELDLELEELLQEEGEDDAPETEEHDERARSIQVLAEALYELTRNSPGRTIGIHISPNGPLSSDPEHAHILDISPALAHQLADHVNALSCHLHSQRPDATVVDRQTVADLTDLFAALDLTDLTNKVLKATRPENRAAVTRALDDMFGDIPVPGIEDTDQ